jgi:hypothetical protein
LENFGTLMFRDAWFGTIGAGKIYRLGSEIAASCGDDFDRISPEQSRHIVMRLIPSNADNVGIA